MIRVLFICLGNICRSPMAEAIFRQLVKEQGLAQQIEVDSAGTGDWHIGAPPHVGTRKILQKYKVDGSGLVARQLQAGDFQSFQYMICMDEDNLRNAASLLKGKYDGELKLLLDYLPGNHSRNVPDPYFTGDFEETYRLLSDACGHLLDHVRALLS